MKKVINCLKEDNPVIQKKLRRVTLEEGKKIATELFEILNKRKDGIGLAANQVGIDASVAVVNVIEPIVLINPEIVSCETEIPYYEGCLSYPGKGVNTKRYETVEVKSYLVVLISVSLEKVLGKKVKSKKIEHLEH
jgi:peptide deformylase